MSDDTIDLRALAAELNQLQEMSDLLHGILPRLSEALRTSIPLLTDLVARVAHLEETFIGHGTIPIQTRTRPAPKVALKTPVPEGVGTILRQYRRYYKHVAKEWMAKRLGVSVRVYKALEEGRSPTVTQYARIKNLVMGDSFEGPATELKKAS